MLVSTSCTRRNSIRDLISETLVNSLKPVYFLLRRNKRPWNITMVSLAAMPAGTLGHDLSLFLKSNGLRVMPRAEVHDVFHVLFGYTTFMKDETCIQFVPLGNGKHSLPYLASTLVAWAFYPEYWGDFYAAFKKGRNARRFHHWDFEQMLTWPTEQVRRRIFG